MSTLREAAQQALEALGFSCPAPHLMSKHAAAEAALRTAIAEAEKQGPVAWISKHSVVYPLDAKDEVHPINELQPLYTTPPAAQRQPLTDEEIDDIWNRYCDEMGEASINDAYDIARAIEAAHGIKEKNT